MTDDLRDRIALAIARVTASGAADEVIREIATTHELVPIATADAIRAFIAAVGSEAPWFGSDGWDLVAAWAGNEVTT